MVDYFGVVEVSPFVGCPDGLTVETVSSAPNSRVVFVLSGISNFGLVVEAINT